MPKLVHRMVGSFWDCQFWIFLRSIDWQRAILTWKLPGPASAPRNDLPQFWPNTPCALNSIDNFIICLIYNPLSHCVQVSRMVCTISIGSSYPDDAVTQIESRSKHWREKLQSNRRVSIGEWSWRGNSWKETSLSFVLAKMLWGSHPVAWTRCTDPIYAKYVLSWFGIN